MTNAQIRPTPIPNPDPDRLIPSMIARTRRIQPRRWPLFVGLYLFTLLIAGLVLSLSLPTAHAHAHGGPPIVAAIAVDAGAVLHAVDAGAGAQSKDSAGPAAAQSDDIKVLTQKLAELQKAYEAWRGAAGPGKLILLFGMLAVGTQILLAAASWILGLSSRGRRWLPLVAAILGLLTGFFTSAAAGQPILVAVFLGAGPMFSVVLHELMAKLRPKVSTGIATSP